MKRQQLNERLLYDVDGIRLELFIDYEAETVSFIHKDGEPFRFVFADRGREYLGGWLRVFKALEEATRDADAKLKKHKGKKENEFMERIYRLTKDIE